MDFFINYLILILIKNNFTNFILIFVLSAQLNIKIKRLDSPVFLFCNWQVNSPPLFLSSRVVSASQLVLLLIAPFSHNCVFRAVVPLPFKTFVLWGPPSHLAG